MKILQVTPRYAPRTGGVEMQLQAISERLVNRGHDVTVLTADAGDDVPRSETRNGVTVHRHRSLSPGGAFHVAPGIAPAVRRAGADVVHAHNVHSLPLIFAALGQGGSRFVATAYYHGTSADGLRSVLWNGYRPVARAALRRADTVSAVSEWERRHVADDFGVDAEQIPLGVDVDAFASATPRVRDRPYLLCVARLEEYKGVQHVVRALPALEGYDLLVAGDGPYREELERIARENGVADRVTFLGTVGHDALPSYYAGAAAHLSLSSFESYGLTVGEALASGTPCVVRDGTALGEWAAVDGCVAVMDPSPAAVASAVRDAVDAPVDVAAVPTWDEVVDRHLSVYGGPRRSDTF
ncbi:glycosyltransferase family 4 protein [Halobaculum rubrum]|uniref:glycosyltransferase family 4 protein n=1 Tax=Halobaculum rubrum TaxID=2872158 RepID=UPI001CA3A07D|nr:glycosyltransferase family 4 protein [Halobaculum rubrum]QZX99913.1 glycosyltransferase family 4 protein [Halobaculum rubrum]